MVEIFVEYHKSTRLPLDPCHVTICIIVTSDYFIRVFSLVHTNGVFFDETNSLCGCCKIKKAMMLHMKILKATLGVHLHMVRIDIIQVIQTEIKHD